MNADSCINKNKTRKIQTLTETGFNWEKFKHKNKIFLDSSFYGCIVCFYNKTFRWVECLNFSLFQIVIVEKKEKLLIIHYYAINQSSDINYLLISFNSFTSND